MPEWTVAVFGFRRFGRRCAALAAAVLIAAPLTAAAAPPTDGAMGEFIVHEKPKPVPDVRFADGEGNEMSLADFAGQVVLVNLWATWCGPCRVEMPELDELQAELGGDDFQVVALSGDRAGAKAVADFYAETGVAHLPIYVDKTMASHRALGAKGLPTTLLLDGSGREVGRMVGAASWASPEAKALITFYIERTGKPGDDGATTTMLRE